MAYAEDSSVSETPEVEKTTKLSHFKNRRNLQYIDVSSDSEDQESQNCSTTKYNNVLQRDVIVM